VAVPWHIGHTQFHCLQRTSLSSQPLERHGARRDELPGLQQEGWARAFRLTCAAPGKPQASAAALCRGGSQGLQGLQRACRTRPLSPPTRPRRYPAIAVWAFRDALHFLKTADTVPLSFGCTAPIGSQALGLRKINTRIRPSGSWRERRLVRGEIKRRLAAVFSTCQAGRSRPGFASPASFSGPINPPRGRIRRADHHEAWCRVYRFWADNHEGRPNPNPIHSLSPPSLPLGIKVPGNNSRYLPSPKSRQSTAPSPISDRPTTIQ
jgi:hypothetical protein